jgi:hypothetical protein
MHNMNNMHTSSHILSTMHTVLSSSTYERVCILEDYSRVLE